MHAVHDKLLLIGKRQEGTFFKSSPLEQLKLKKGAFSIKFRSKLMMIGASILVSATIAAFMVINQENEPEGNNAVSHSNTHLQSDSKDNTDEEIEGADNGIETGSGTNSAEKGLSSSETASEPNTAAAILAEGDTVTSNTGTQQTGLYFATREEAIAFGFSRFTAEEIELYNRASANGLTPEQEEMAIQMAYSRFSQEEIAAIEDALNR